MDQKQVQALSLILLSVFLTVIHYVIPLEAEVAQTILQEVFYLPAILGVLLFGRWPGMLFTLFIFLIYTPHIVIEWSNEESRVLYKINELILMAGVSFLVGTVIDKLHYERERVAKGHEQIVRIEKLALLGKLSAGLAHEIRNPLGSMKGSVDIIASELGDDHSMASFVEVLRTELKSLTNRLNNFLTFARPTDPTVIDNSLSLMVSSVKELLLQKLEDSRITLIINIKSDDKEFPMDYEQLRQILINLIMNSAQQIETTGIITVTTYNDDKTFGFSVEDNGGGIDQYHLNKIFEPFFTTKESGTGLGLSIATEMIQNMNGTISVENGRDGAIFTVRIRYGK